MSEESDIMPHVSRRVRELRARKGLSAKQVGERMTERCGVTWDRFTVANLETGRRKNLTVDELLALARVLDVAPVHLLVPIDDQPFRMLPKEEQPADRVRAWVCGDEPLPGTDRRIFRTEVPLDEVPEMRTVRFGGRHGSAQLNEAFEEDQRKGRGDG